MQSSSTESENSYIYAKVILDTGVVPFLAQHLLSTHEHVQKFSILVLKMITERSSEQGQVSYEQDAISHLPALLNHHDLAIRDDAISCLVNITCNLCLRKAYRSIDNIIENELMTMRQIAGLFWNLSSMIFQNQMEELVTAGMIKALGGLFQYQDNRVVTVSSFPFLKILNFNSIVF